MTDLPTPDTRTEVYLARAAGADVTIPQQPQTRTEVYLEAIAEGGGGGSVDYYDIALTTDSYQHYTMDETDAEVIAQFEAGKLLRVVLDESTFLTVTEFEYSSDTITKADVYLGTYGSRDILCLTYIGEGEWDTDVIDVPTEISIAQTTGSSTRMVMSQKATTDMLSATHTASTAFLTMLMSLIQSFIVTAGTNPGVWVRASASYNISANPDEYAEIKGLVNAVYDDFTTHAKCFIDLSSGVFTVGSASTTSVGKVIATSLTPLGSYTFGYLNVEWTSSSATMIILGFIPANV